MATVTQHFKHYTSIIDMNNLKVKHLAEMIVSAQPDDILFFGFLRKKTVKTTFDDLMKIFNEERKNEVERSVDKLISLGFLTKTEISDEGYILILK
jgi:predicted transcriptional regulator